MNNSPKLFISIGNLEIFLIAGSVDDHNNFKLLKKIILQTENIQNYKINNLNKISNLIKKNVIIIEQKLNYTFKDIIIIINNFEITFLNLCGFKKLNGTQVSKENITYILNSLKACVDQIEENKKILHIFNSKYCLDKKKLDNLPIGLFGDFYSHELSFNLIDKNNFKNLENIFKLCNLKIKKILLESFVKSSLVVDTYPKIDTFFYIQIGEDHSKIFYVEKNALKFEQEFNFGTEIIVNDICKVTSLEKDIVKKIISDNENISKTSDKDLLEEKYFNIHQFKKIKKNLIAQIAEARIDELSEKFYLRNINLKKLLKEADIIFLEINNYQHFRCFSHTYKESFASKSKHEVRIVKKPTIEQIVLKADNIAQYGWKNEAIPVAKSKKSFLTRVFQAVFE